MACAGITYYTVSQTTMSKDAAESGDTTIVEKADTPLEKDPFEEPPTIGSTIYLEPGKATTVSTEDGYVKFSDPSAVKILRRGASQVTFQLNYGVGSVNVDRKDGGEIVTSTYTTEKEN